MITLFVCFIYFAVNKLTADKTQNLKKLDQIIF